MALHQLFTLAFALHLEPLPTLDYATVPYVRDRERSTDSLEEPEELRVGANTKLEPIHSHHLPHSVNTLSFLLNHTRAIDAIEPFSKLIGLLDEADDDPEFRNLREFFDARYAEDGTLVGAEKEPRRRMRSISRAASTKQQGRRSSQATEGRKPSFAASLGGASALKLNWLRRNNNSENQPHEGSDDEDSHSRVSSSGKTANPAPPSAPYIRLSKRALSSSPSSTHSSSSHHRYADHECTTLVTFRVRLDLHTIGLAPPPPKLRIHRQQDTFGTSLGRTGSGRSATSSDWRRRRPRNSSLSSGGAALRPVASPDSMASFGAMSAIANGDPEHPAGPGKLTVDTSAVNGASTYNAVSNSRMTSSGETPSLTASGETHLPSITEGAISVPSQPSSPNSIGGKPSRRPSMMSKLLDFGRKKSFLDRPASEAQDSRSALPGPAHGEVTTPSASTHRASFLSGVRHHLGNGTACNEEALDLDEDDDDGALHARMMQQLQKGGSKHGRRRSSAGSSGKNYASSRSTNHDLRPVQEDGQLDLTMISSRSSVGTTFSEQGIPEGSIGGKVWSAQGASVAASNRRPAAVMDGQDFLTLFRAASSLGLQSIQDSLGGDEKNATLNGNGDGGDVTTPGQESVRSAKESSAYDTVGADTPSVRTPKVQPKTSSLPAMPGRSIGSLDLDRSPNSRCSTSNPIDASFQLGASLAKKKGGEDDEAWWPCGDVDPLPVSIASALGQALGWEGIMHLCYGKGSRAASKGNFLALGKAAALDQANKVQERSVLAWRTGVASAGTSPPKGDAIPSLDDLTASDAANLASSVTQKLNLHPANSNVDTATNASILERLHEKAPQRSATMPQDLPWPPGDSNGNGQTAGYNGASTAWDQASLLFGSKVNHARTWQHWHALFKSIKGWIDEYEKTRVRNALAREIGLDRPVETAANVGGADQDEASSITLSAPVNMDVGSPDAQVPLTFGSPPTASTEVLKVARDKVDASTLSRVLATSLSISPCVLADATNRAHGFRRRVGVPEGLPLGPEDEEAIDYTWSRKKLSVEHFATALTIGCDSTLHFFSQLSTSNWPHRSAWELDYLEMCVFKSPLVADRFPPPGEAVVPASQSYRPAQNARDRSRVCPNPDQAGAWNPDVWKRWLISIQEGDIIVPAVAWQAWWTLISVLNGADRTGRSYDLQLKALEEPFDALTDLNAVYL